MNDRWQKGGRRWNAAERQRVARRFRHHVRTPWNPLGRIQRDLCFFCVRNALAGGYPRLEHLSTVSAHHVDYARPFVVVWACDSHHRQIDHGVLRIPLRAICDYTSLIEAPGVAQRGNRYESRLRTGTDDVPF